jgi:adenosine kinase
LQPADIRGWPPSQPFSLNLSAPFIPQFFSQQLDSILPYASLVIGNESEAVAYAEAHSYGTSDLKAIAEKLAASPSELQGARTVIITHGSEPTIVVEGGRTREIETAKIASEDIVDTNGAGDAFAGGVVGALILGKSIEEAVKVGQKLGGMCIGQVGPCLKFREFSCRPHTRTLAAACR